MADAPQTSTEIMVTHVLCMGNVQFETVWFELAESNCREINRNLRGNRNILLIFLRLGGQLMKLHVRFWADSEENTIFH